MRIQILSFIIAVLFFKFRLTVQFELNWIRCSIMQHLLSGMLHPDPVKRFSMEQVALHDWFSIEF